MAQLVVRNLEPRVKARLQRRASQHGQSMEQEVRDILRDAVTAEQDFAAPLGTRLRERFAGVGLNHDFEELRGQKVRPAVFKR